MIYSRYFNVTGDREINHTDKTRDALGKVIARETSVYKDQQLATLIKKKV